MANLTNALGTSPAPLLRDWAISVFLDDNAPNVDPRYQQPSWNIRSVLDGGRGVHGLPAADAHVLSDNVPVSLNLAGYGVSFLRFSVANGQDALLTVTSQRPAAPADDAAGGGSRALRSPTPSACGCRDAFFSSSATPHAR